MVNIAGFNYVVNKSNDLATSSVVKHVAISVGGLGFDSRAGQIGHCRQWFTTTAS